MWHHLHDLLTDRLRKDRHRPQIEGARAIVAFSETIKTILPPDVRHDVRAIKLVDNVLTVEVSHPAILQIVRREEPRLLSALIQAGHPISRITFFLNTRRPTESSP